MSHWRIFADTGGTFTDCLALSPDGAWHRAKVLSSGVLRTDLLGNAPWRVGLPDSFLDGIPFQRTEDILTYSPGLEAPLVAAHLVTKTPFSQPLPPLELRLGTTRGTNALLTRTGTPPVFFVTAGFEDLLRIGNQARPDLFALDIARPEPLYAESVGVEERLSADGTVLHPLDEAKLRLAATRLAAAGYRTAAVALLHAWRNPVHEQRVAELLRACGFTHVSLSSELAALQKLLPRAETAVVNAYLTPVLESYLSGVQRGLSAGSSLTVMTSAGGLVPVSQFRPKDSLLSGPAGGVVGACESGLRAGFQKLIAFDMGGTSTDVARIEAPELPYVFEHKVGDALLLAPAVAVESVAAGGGSICGSDSHGRLFVGPASAGAQPGPACYGAGGPLTITDINLLLGHIPERDFSLPLNRSAAESALHAVAEKSGQPKEALLHAFYDLANEAMADAIRQISVRKGYDPTEHALVAFGGAGGQHACAIAEKLGIRTVVVPPDQSLLSAFGIAHARRERFAERQVLQLLDQTDIPALLTELESEALAALAEPGEVIRRIARLRLVGQETPLEVPVTPALAEEFRRHFTQLYGYAPDPSRGMELESLRVVVAAAESIRPEPTRPEPTRPEPTRPEPTRPRSSATLPLRRRVEGGLIVEAFSVTVVRAGWTETTSESGALILRQTQFPPLLLQGGEVPGGLELFTRRFESVATEMGEALRRTALSVNVKERLDYSCALLGPHGDLVATAAHIPVHLGALGVCVRELIRAKAFVGEQPIIVNHPAFGGSHLPDITVVTPVFSPAGRGSGGRVLLGFVASRAHHAELGGTRPGSMPPGARTLVEEGVVIPPTPWNRERLTALLTTAPYPTRALADNLADLEAQLAANHQGAQALRALAQQHGPEKLFALQATLADRCEQIARRAISARAISPGSFLATPSSPHGSFLTGKRGRSLSDGEMRPSSRDEGATGEEGSRLSGREMARRDGREMAALDDGYTIQVALRYAGEKLVVDFTGTSPTHPANFNAPPAVTVACVLFVLRLLIGEEVPLNEGLLRAVEIILPPDTLLKPTFHADPTLCPAVVAGNTEVSQRVVAALLQAFGLSAGSQATMNNTLFGNARFGYYETVCGGAGATATAPGASAVHTHMTNTRITDPEIIEARYPVRLERFSVRSGSGGIGKYPGGEGIVREYVFLEPVAVSLLTQSRITGGFGADGGSDGAPGQQRIVRLDGHVETLPGVAAAECAAGDRLILETPGGGGYGKP